MLSGVDMCIFMCIRSIIKLHWLFKLKIWLRRRAEICMWNECTCIIMMIRLFLVMHVCTFTSRCLPQIRLDDDDDDECQSVSHAVRSHGYTVHILHIYIYTCIVVVTWYGHVYPRCARRSFHVHRLWKYWIYHDTWICIPQIRWLFAHRYLSLSVYIYSMYVCMYVHTSSIDTYVHGYVYPRYVDLWGEVDCQWYCQIKDIWIICSCTVYGYVYPRWWGGLVGWLVHVFVVVIVAM